MAFPSPPFGNPTVLTKEGLDNIANHKYVAGAYTPLDNALNPYWLAMAEALPRWLAPNLVTLMGFLPMVLSLALTWQASPYFDTPPSRALALYTALANFTYQTLDALDGKQARRTSSSSPLGQLFDHGCDCMTCLGQHSVAMMVLLPGPNRWSLVSLATICTGFFMTQWHERHAHWLPTACGPFGVTELQMVWIAWALVAAVLGPESVQAFATKEVAVPVVGQSLPVGHLVTVGWLCCFSVLALVCLVATLRQAFAHGGLRMSFQALLQLIPVTVLNAALALVWDDRAFTMFPRTLSLMTGMRFCFFSAQVILFSMAKMELPIFQLATLLPYVWLAVASQSLDDDQLQLAMALDALMVTLWVFRWVVTVIQELKERLNIYAFSLEKPGRSVHTD